ncbi:MAG: hypothetical protein ACHQVS_04100 [Candidatus Babeliales bacterium]
MKNLSILLSTILSATLYSMEQNHVVIVADKSVPQSIVRALQTPSPLFVSSTKIDMSKEKLRLATPGMVLAQKIYGGRTKFRACELDTLGKNVRPVKRAVTVKVVCNSKGSLIRHSKDVLEKEKKKKNEEKKA